MKKTVFLVADLGFGDAGKGSMVDFLVREHNAHTVVRYNGGPQAAHTVVTPDNHHHTFSQFGSGTFVPGVATHLSRFMLIDPISLLSEERALQGHGISNALSRLTIEDEALVITPFQRAANRLRELARGNSRHGSCGMGVGETMADFLAHGKNVLLAGDLCRQTVSEQKLRFLQQAKLADVKDILHQLPAAPATTRELTILQDTDAVADCLGRYRYIAEQIRVVDRSYLGQLLRQPGTVVFEGAQGVLLDEWFGFHPYTTWSTITFANAEALLSDPMYDGTVERVGVVRAYATRHGAGPFVTEDPLLTTKLPDTYNITNPWQHHFRIGWFDSVATRYALAVAGSVDWLAVTNLDRLAHLDRWQVCDAYHYRGTAVEQLPRFFQVTAENARRVTKILVHRPADLRHQEQLTSLLMECQPEYQPAPSEPTRYLDLLAKSLGVGVMVVSYGPTAHDKVYRK